MSARRMILAVGCLVVMLLAGCGGGSEEELTVQQGYATVFAAVPGGAGVQDAATYEPGSQGFHNYFAINNSGLGMGHYWTTHKVSETELVVLLEPAQKTVAASVRYYVYGDINFVTRIVQPVKIYAAKTGELIYEGSAIAEDLNVFFPEKVSSSRDLGVTGVDLNEFLEPWVGSATGITFYYQ